MSGSGVIERLPVAEGDAFRNEIRQYAERMIRRSEESEYPYMGESHRETLAAFARWIGSVELNDGRLVALAKLRDALGNVDEEGTRHKGWLPGKEQRSVLATAGQGLSSWNPEEVCSNVLISGVEDLWQKARAFQREAQKSAEAEARADAQVSKNEELQAEVAAAKVEVKAAHEKTQELRDTAAYLQEQLAATVGPEEAEDKRRRIRLEGHTGVYRRPGSDDLEIGYRRNGIQKWEVVGPLTPAEAGEIRLERILDAKQKQREEESVPVETG